MAHIDIGEEKRDVAIEPNIVPFIDLMSVLIIFLLITAVWTQVSMIQIGSSIYGQRSEDQEVEPPPRAEVPFRLDIFEGGYQIIVGQRKTTVPKIDNEYDTKTLVAELKSVKEIYPEKNDAVVTMVDSLPYLALIGGMDSLLSAGFPEVSIATAGAR